MLSLSKHRLKIIANARIGEFANQLTASCVMLSLSKHRLMITANPQIGKFANQPTTSCVMLSLSKHRLKIIANPRIGEFANQLSGLKAPEAGLEPANASDLTSECTNLLS